MVAWKVWESMNHICNTKTSLSGRLTKSGFSLLKSWDPKDWRRSLASLQWFFGFAGSSMAICRIFAWLVFATSVLVDHFLFFDFEWLLPQIFLRNSRRFSCLFSWNLLEFLKFLSFYVEAQRYQFVFPYCGQCGLDFFGFKLANWVVRCQKKIAVSVDCRRWLQRQYLTMSFLLYKLCFYTSMCTNIIYISTTVCRGAFKDFFLYKIE